jgi:hypothetical protein
MHAIRHVWEERSSKPQADLPREIVDLAWRAQLRLNARYRHLGARLCQNADRGRA